MINVMRDSCHYLLSIIYGPRVVAYLLALTLVVVSKPQDLQLHLVVAGVLFLYPHGLQRLLEKFADSADGARY